MNNGTLLAFSTFPDEAIARQIAERLVHDRLATCANILPQIDSIYHWKGKLEHATETLVLFKTSADTYTAFEAELRSLHPYDIPEIIAVDIAAGLPEYLRWVIENTSHS